MMMDIEDGEVRLGVRRSVHRELGEVTCSNNRPVEEAQDKQDNDIQCLESSKDNELRRMFEIKIPGTSSCTSDRKTLSQLIFEDVQNTKDIHYESPNQRADFEAFEDRIESYCRNIELRN